MTGNTETTSRVPLEGLVSLFAQLQEKDVAVQIQKLAYTTTIMTCNARLWSLTGHLTRESRCPHDRPLPTIRDLGYCVWRCRIGMKHTDNWFYGKSISDAISEALKANAAHKRQTKEE